MFGNGVSIPNPATGSLMEGSPSMSVRCYLIPIAVLAFLATVLAISFASMALEDHDPIVISGDGDLTAANGVVSGRGYVHDPFVIEGWSISCPDGTGISIEGTGDHLVIRDIVLSTKGGDDAVGVLLTHVSNCTIENLTIEGLRYGIKVYHIDSLSIDDVKITNCTYGLNGYCCDDLVVERVRIYDCITGMTLSHGEGFSVEDCVVKAANGIIIGDYGQRYTKWVRLLDTLVEGEYRNIDLKNTDDSRVEGCTVKNPRWENLRLYYTHGTVLRNNVLDLGGIVVEGHPQNPNIDGSNTVGGVPVRYLKGVDGDVVDGPSGQVFLVDCANVTVANQSFEGVLNPVQLYSSPGCTVVNCTIEDAYRGIRLRYCPDFLVSHVSMVSSGTERMLVDGISVSGGGGRIDDCVIGPGYNKGLSVYGQVSVSLTNTSIRDFGSLGVRLTPERFDWDIYEGGLLSMDGCSVVGNTVGISGYHWRLRISGTTFEDNSESAVTTSGGEEVVITGCVFRNNGLAISVTDAVMGLIRDNTVSRSTGIGIHVIGSIISLTHNSISGVGTGVLVEQASQVEIMGNDVSGTDGPGIEVRSCHGGSLTKGTVTGCGIGLLVNGSSEVSVREVTVVGCGLGLVFERASNATVTKCTAQRCKGQGIVVRSSVDLHIHHNNLVENYMDLGTGYRYGPQALDVDGQGNAWDDGSEGNYWSDMKKRYPQASIQNGRTWNMSYEVPDDGSDRYPLGRFIDFLPPVADAGEDQTVGQGTRVTLDGSGSTDNVRTWHFIWSLDYRGETYRMAGKVSSFTFNVPGRYLVTLRVQDQAGNEGQDMVWINVLDTEPPMAHAGNGVEVKLGQSFYLIGSRSKDNVGIVSYRWTVDPDGLDIELEGEVVALSLDDYGSYCVVLEVADAAGNRDTDAITVRVVDISPPYADAGSDIQVAMGTLVIFNGSGCRDDTGVTEWLWSLELGTQEIALTGVSPTQFFDVPGVFRVFLRVSDAYGNVAFDGLTVFVFDAEPPLADGGEDLVIGNGQEFLLDGGGSSDNYRIECYSWTISNDTWSVQREGLRVPMVIEWVGSYTVTLRVTDFDGNWDEDTITVTVLDVTPPVARAGKDITVPQEMEVVLDGSTSRDNVGITEGRWTIFTGHDPIELEGLATRYTFVVPGTYHAALEVTDTSGLTDSDHITITVHDTEFPISNAGSDRWTVVGTIVRLDGTLSTDNGAISEYRWTYLCMGEKMTLQGAIVNVAFDELGDYHIELRVTDDGGNCASDEVVLRVFPSEVPLYIGPFTDLNTDPVSGVYVTAFLNDTSYYGRSDATGWMQVHVSTWDLALYVDVRATKEGYYPLTFQLQMDEWGVPVGKVPPMEREPSPVQEREGSSSLLPVVVVIALATIVLSFVAYNFITRGRRQA